MQKASPPPKINKKNKLTPTPSPTIDKDIAKRAKKKINIEIAIIPNKNQFFFYDFL